MKVYIASSFDLIPLVKVVAEALIFNGHKITEKWWNREYDVDGIGRVKTTHIKELYNELSDEAFYKKPETKESYLLDLKGIEEADSFILVSGLSPRKFNGANIELGYALANGLLCLSIGELEKSVMYWDVIRCHSVTDLMIALNGDPYG